MNTIPLTSSEYRAWWQEQRPDISYGFCWCGCGEKTAIPEKSNFKLSRLKGEPVRFIRGHWQRQSESPFASALEYHQYWEQEYPNVPYGYCCCGCGQETPLAKKTSSAELRFRGEPTRFIRTHAHRSSPLEYIEEDRGYYTLCWVWQRSTDTAGYARMWDGEKVQRAHRVYYIRARGPIPKGLEPDHLCTPWGGPRNCVRPDHLELVTHTENIRRGNGSVLSMQKARQIRRVRKKQNLTYPIIAQMFGVSGSLVGQIINNDIWREDQR